jgi:hypothetical protein
MGQSFFEKELQGKSLWIVPPQGKEQLALITYHKMKSKDPQTSAVFVLPTSARGQRHPWLNLIRDMTKVGQIDKDQRVWIDTDNGLPSPTRREVDILYDPPCRVQDVLTESSLAAMKEWTSRT